MSTTNTTMTATIKSNYRTTFHRDGSVSYWNVYQQQWVREQASQVSDQDLASMSNSDRERMARRLQRVGRARAGVPLRPVN